MRLRYHPAVDKRWFFEQGGMVERLAAAIQLLRSWLGSFEGNIIVTLTGLGGLVVALSLQTLELPRLRRHVLGSLSTH